MYDDVTLGGEMMQNANVNFVFTVDTFIAIIGIVVTILIAGIGGIYAIVTNTKKYELTENYRKELLQWYTSVVTLMVKTIHFLKTGEYDSAAFLAKKMDMLSQLSALAEVGRFYFPNVVDNFGKWKPSAYQGHRHVILEYLLQFYRTALKDTDGSQIAELWRIERSFTSEVFDIVEPRKRKQDYVKYLDIKFSKDQASYSA